MQISLRSQMLAGTTALVGATAIAMTPIAPAASLPSINAAKAEVALSAFANPLNALLATGGTVVHYLLGSGATGIGGATAADNWPGSQVSDAVNTLVLPGLGVATSGIVPNILANPFPVGTQLVNNWLGYGGTAINSGAALLAAASTIAWLPVNVTATAIADIIQGAPQNIPTDITNAINLAVQTATQAVQLAVAGVVSIVNGIITRGTAVLTNLSAELPTLVTSIQGQITALSATLANVATNVSAGYVAGGLSGAWNAGVVGLLSTVAPQGSTYTGLTLPGTVVNLTEGAGVQLVAGNAGATSFVPSVRTVLTGTATTIANGLATPAPGPVPVAAVRSAAAAKTASAAAAKPAAVKRAAAAARSAK